MSAITKERIELFIKNPLDNGLTRGEQMEVARIALASLEAKPIGAFHIAEQQVDGTSDYLKDGEWPIDNGIIEVYAAPTVPVVPGEIADDLMEKLPKSDAWANGFRGGWNACRAVMLQSGNFREIAETSTNSPVIHGDVLSAILKFARVRADFDDFDGDRRGIGDCLDEAVQELIVTINKYASRLAAEPIAPNDVREQTAIPPVPVTPDGWISCSERMPNDKQYVWCWGKSYGWTECDTFEGYYDWSRNKWWAVTDNEEEQASKVTHWMPLPEPPQEVNRG
ncbi:TPA: DUF551 domain-containing protein [Escherichia coli]|nr:DUF551 domain-containing protein [Escherichia coli]